MKNIKIEVKEDGSFELDMNGFEGEACAVDLEKILNELASKGVEVNVKNIVKKEDVLTQTKQGLGLG